MNIQIYTHTDQNELVNLVNESIRNYTLGKVKDIKFQMVMTGKQIIYGAMIIYELRN